VPGPRPALVRCILDSLAAAYARTIDEAARLAGRSVEVVHLVGGGARNELLCQLTADACERPVLAGPAEATAIGNILVQARAQGLVSGDLEALRALIRATHPLRRYEPGRRPAPSLS
jgi:rhamnulokinase